MRSRDLDALEFDRVRQQLALFARSPGGKEVCRALAPCGESATATATLDLVWQCFRLTEKYGQLPVGEFPDIRAALRTASHEGAVLDGETLVAIRRVVATAQSVRAFVKSHCAEYPQMQGFPERLPLLQSLHTALTRALDDRGAVVDDACGELARVRRTMRQLREQLNHRLEGVFGRSGMADVISERYVTVRNNRFVIPIKTAAAGRFDGVVQDRSISGETTFVEPLFAVEMNNRLLMAAQEEEALIRRILADLTALVRSEHDAVLITYDALVELDSLNARATFARRYRCTCPQFGDEVLLRQARHPILLFEEQHEVVPLDMTLPAEKRIFIVTGPNTGGKTVALKTLGLLALMAQSGILIPAAEGSKLPCFGAIYADVGDEQSIVNSLSTFSAHVTNLTDIIERQERAFDANAALVLLDEPGMGTDPEEGAALGIGVVQALEALGAWVAVSTHYAPMKMFALGHESCVTAAVDFDIDAMAPRYRLVPHSVGESLAMPIARRLGLPERILSAAEAVLSTESKTLATALSQLEASRRHYEERMDEAEARVRASRQAQQEVDALRAELLEKKRGHWREELQSARAFVRDVRDRGKTLLSNLEKGAADRRALQQFVQRQESAITAQREVLTDTPRPQRPPRVGDQVRVGETGIQGELLSVDGARAWLRRGSMRFEVPAAQLQLVAGAAQKPQQPRPAQVAVQMTSPSGDTSSELNLLGLRTKEAVMQLDAYLDRAVRAHYPFVRIIHGVGSGALRRVVTEYLSTSHYCNHFRPGEAGEGGAGVTVVQLAEH